MDKELFKNLLPEVLAEIDHQFDIEVEKFKKIFVEGFTVWIR